MSKGKNQKLKLIYLLKLFYESTDDKNGITMSEILQYLKLNDIAAERKSIYADIKELQNFGIDIIGEKVGTEYYYHIGNRTFELAELKLLVDAVQASKFITLKKSQELINKLEGLTSKYEAKQLQRQVFVAERIKTMNESIYYNVDKIHEAISIDVKIKFQYFQWNLNKQMELRKNGEFYFISPWALTWTNENYYMIGYDSENNKIKHYRVDKMLNIEVTDDIRQGKEHFEKFDMGSYAKRVFNMFGGEFEKVRLECENNLIGVIIDRFGKDVVIVKKDKEHFYVNVEVAVSNQFIGWVIGIGSGVRIISPQKVVKKIEKEIIRLQGEYHLG